MHVIDDAVVVGSVQIVKDDGSVNYPVDVTHPVDLVINVTVRGTTTYNNITLAASLARYTSIFGQCSWAVIPTLGLLYVYNISNQLYRFSISVTILTHVYSTGVHLLLVKLPVIILI